MKEANRLSVCKQVESGMKESSVMLAISYRQMKRIWQRYKQKGGKGLAHGNRGRPSNRAMSLDLRQWLKKEGISYG